MKKLWEWLFGTRNKQLDIPVVSDMFYCEIETNPAHQKCKEQCDWCKIESDKMKQ